MKESTMKALENIKKEYANGKVIPCHWEMCDDGNEHLRLDVELGVSLTTIRRYINLEHSAEGEPVGYKIVA